jgi:uncharacterized membrane protein YhhN
MLWGAVALSALLAIACEVVAERSGRRPAAFLLLKPLTTLLILAAATSAPAPMPHLLVAALVFCTLGDIALMFTGERWFLAGLGSFFVAHLLFMAIFGHDLQAYALPLWSWAFVAYAVGFFAWLWPRTGALRWPTLAYGVVLTALVLAAAGLQAQRDDTVTTVGLAGALLFALSDSALAVCQFRGAYRAAQPLILTTYWSGLGLMAWAAAAAA